MVGAITTLGVCCAVRNLCARSGQKSILCHFCMGRWDVEKKQRAFGTATRIVRVAVPRRRGPAGLRDPIAVSLTALMGFTVLFGHSNRTQGKILAGFTRWSAPSVLPPADVPVPAPQHPTAADKTGRWKTGWAGSCRADFRFACARPA